MADSMTLRDCTTRAPRRRRSALARERHLPSLSARRRHQDLVNGHFAEPVGINHHLAFIVPILGWADQQDRRWWCYSLQHHSTLVPVSAISRWFRLRPPLREASRDARIGSPREPPA